MKSRLTLLERAMLIASRMISNAVFFQSTGSQHNSYQSIPQERVKGTNEKKEAEVMRKICR